jgi:hypothetical protein
MREMDRTLGRKLEFETFEAVSRFVARSVDRTFDRLVRGVVDRGGSVESRRSPCIFTVFGTALVSTPSLQRRTKELSDDAFLCEKLPESDQFYINAGDFFWRSEARQQILAPLAICHRCCHQQNCIPTNGTSASISILTVGYLSQRWDIMRCD